VSPGSKSKTGDASITPVLLSIAVLPGLGQWMQRRYNAGTFYLAGFSLLSMMTVVILIRQFMSGSLPDTDFVKPLGAVLFIYVANVIDVLRGRLQLQKRFDQRN
jgi:hypothetical protein